MKSGMAVTTEWIIKAVPENGMSMDELEARMKALGNKVLRREADGLVVIQDKSTQFLGVVDGL